MDMKIKKYFVLEIKLIILLQIIININHGHEN